MRRICDTFKSPVFLYPFTASAVLSSALLASVLIGNANTERMAADADREQVQQQLFALQYRHSGARNQIAVFRESIRNLQQELAGAKQRQAAAPVAIESAPVLESRHVDLPEDGDKWFTILFLTRDWKNHADQANAVKLWYGKLPHSEWLVELKGQTNARVIYTDEPQFQQFRQKKDGTPLVSGVPTLLIERANGEVVYLESGKSLAHHPADLRKAVVLEMKRRCPNGQCLPLFPTPASKPTDGAIEEEKPQDEVPAVIHEAPPAAPAPADQKKSGPSPIVALVGLAAIFAAILVIGKGEVFASKVKKGLRG